LGAKWLAGKVPIRRGSCDISSLSIKRCRKYNETSRQPMILVDGPPSAGFSAYACIIQWIPTYTGPPADEEDGKEAEEEKVEGARGSFAGEWVPAS
jgi:hypothetical protein